MRIEAAGRTWIVEEEELAPGLGGDAGPFYGVTFRDERRAGDLLRVRWVLKPGRLTPRDARALFERAEQRVWRDRRDGCVYRVTLEGGVEADAPGAGRSVCFQSAEGTTCTAWAGLGALGFATDGQLESLLDSARDA